MYAIPNSVEAKQTQDRGMGLFATATIDRRELFLEYCGQVKRFGTFEKDQERYMAQGMVTDYSVGFGGGVNKSHKYVVDAAEYGNLARFANMSHLNPNCIVQMVSCLLVTVIKFTLNAAGDQQFKTDRVRGNSTDRTWTGDSLGLWRRLC